MKFQKSNKKDGKESSATVSNVDCILKYNPHFSNYNKILHAMYEYQ
ncbi:MAG: hypothetical protein WCP69_15570 [Bacteroidota bacterium]